MREIKPVRQNEGEDFRRWFTDDYWDLYVWIDEKDDISGFQLCYGKPDSEHALTWGRDGKFTHTRISGPGDLHAGNIMSPILVTDGFFDYRAVSGRFWKDSAGLAPAVRSFVYTKTREFQRPARGQR